MLTCSRRQGYRVETYGERASASAGMGREAADLAILDIGLETFDAGFDLCRELRSRSGNPADHFLTARDGDIDTVAGLRVTAGDYVTRTSAFTNSVHGSAHCFADAEAVREQAPDEARGRRRPAAPAARADARQLAWHGRGADGHGLWILYALVRHPGHVKSREQLMEAADTYVDLATITSHHQAHPQEVPATGPPDSTPSRPVYGAGYRWVTQG